MWVCMYVCLYVCMYEGRMGVTYAHSDAMHRGSEERREWRTRE